MNPRESAPVLAAAGLAVGHRGGAVLTGVDLVVRAGERLALVGANGSGKTTLLRVLAGLAPPLAGALGWARAEPSERGLRPLPDGAARVRTVGVLFQGEPASRFTVRELVALGLALDAPPSPAARARIDDALALAELSALAERPCATLSGGEAQRARWSRRRAWSCSTSRPTTSTRPAARWSRRCSFGCAAGCAIRSRW
jgi:ABC-type sulfate/molybdate transport systems ATPase subunit